MIKARGKLGDDPMTTQIVEVLFRAVGASLHDAGNTAVWCVRTAGSRLFV